MSAANPPYEIKIVRLYDAPVDAVWEAWSDPAQLAQWWGPRGFSITTYKKETKTGGTWHYTMHGPDGAKWETVTKYLEVVPRKKLVYDHGGNDERPPLFRVTVLFSEEGKKTKMDMTMTVPSAEALAQTRQIIKQARGNSTWDRLAEHLEKQISGTDKFVIAQAFDAPIGLMFDVWTSPKHLAQWLPPAGFTMNFIECDIRPGGSSFYWMGNGSMKMYGIAHYLTIDRPHRLVYTQQFADEKRKVARHPMAPTWPETMLTTVQFAEESPNRTRVTVTWEPYGADTTEEIATFVKMRGGMTQGWSGSFDKLEEYLPHAASASHTG